MALEQGFFLCVQWVNTKENKLSLPIRQHKHCTFEQSDTKLLKLHSVEEEREDILSRHSHPKVGMISMSHVLCASTSTSTLLAPYLFFPFVRNTRIHLPASQLLNSKRKHLRRPLQCLVWRWPAGGLRALLFMQINIRKTHSKNASGKHV